MHTQGGYLAYAAMTHEYVFDYKPGDIYWCTADVGWVTGHSYIVYGPLANGATTLMFEGVPTWPDAGRFWQVCEKHKVTQFYTAPTAIRALMGKGTGPVEASDLSSLRILGSVGEPINPEAWNWYHENVGKGRCPIVDTFWQTETGGILITPLPGVEHEIKPGSATRPFFGVQPAVLEPESGKEITETEASGVLCMRDSWPGQMRTIWGDHDRFEATYFQQYKGYYFTGDGCRRDADGDYWITGRVDDVINVSGHRMGTAEVESALVAHSSVSEAAVVGYPHDIKGQGIYCYVTLMDGIEPTDALRAELQQWVRTEIGAIAKPDVIQWAPGLPKTRSGKIMRRILRKIAENEHDASGTPRRSPIRRWSMTSSPTVPTPERAGADRRLPAPPGGGTPMSRTDRGVARITARGTRRAGMDPAGQEEIFSQREDTSCPTPKTKTSKRPPHIGRPMCASFSGAWRSGRWFRSGSASCCARCSRGSPWAARISGSGSPSKGRSWSFWA